MPGSPQATPGEAKNGGPQELLQPPHILDDPAGWQRRRRERVSGWMDGRGSLQEPQVGSKVPQYLPLPQKRVKAQAAGNRAGEEQRQARGLGGGTKQDAEVLVT